MSAIEKLTADLEIREKNGLIDGNVHRHIGSERSFGRQLFACASPIISAICFGMTTGLTGTLLPNVRYLVDEETGSWLGPFPYSLVYTMIRTLMCQLSYVSAGGIILSMPVGNILCIFMMRPYGRRSALILSHLPWIIGWIYLSFSENFWSLLLGCVFIGFSAGFNSAVGNVYFAETCEPRLRGLFLGFISTSVSVGILLTHSLGIVFFWRTALRIGATIPIMSFFFSTFAPESVTWLVLKGRIEQAERNFFWLRENTVDNEREFYNLLNRRTENMRRNRRGVIKNVFSTKFFKPFLILVVLFTVQQGSGLNVVIFYAMDMLHKMSKDIGVESCTILIDIVRLISAIISCVLLKYTPRRTMYFVSAACTVLSLVAIVVAIITNLSSAVLIIFLCFYICSMQSGIVTIPWLMNSEIYPTIIRDVGSVLSTIYTFLIQFTIVKIGLFMFSHVGLPRTLSIYAVIIFIGASILYFIMPETRNVTLQEAEDKAAKNKIPITS